MSQMRTIDSVDSLVGFDELSITGGEPMLVPDLVRSVALRFRELNPTSKIYLYTALWTPSLGSIIRLVDGVQFTLHYPLMRIDLDGFSNFQSMAFNHPNKSFRCYIDPAIEARVPVWPKVWTRLEVKPWMKECPLPVGESLFLLKPML